MSMSPSSFHDGNEESPQMSYVYICLQSYTELFAFTRLNEIHV